MKKKGNGQPGHCALNVLRTVRGEAPLQRIMGLDPSMIDKPPKAAELKNDISNQLKWYEPRITLQDVSVEINGNTGDATIAIKGGIHVLYNKN